MNCDLCGGIVIKDTTGNYTCTVCGDSLTAEEVEGACPMHEQAEEWDDFDDDPDWLGDNMLDANDDGEATPADIEFDMNHPV